MLYFVLPFVLCYTTFWDTLHFVLPLILFYASFCSTLNFVRRFYKLSDDVCCTSLLLELSVFCFKYIIYGLFLANQTKNIKIKGVLLPLDISLVGFILDNPQKSCVTNLWLIQGVPINIGINRRLENRLFFWQLMLRCPRIPKFIDFQYASYFIPFISPLSTKIQKNTDVLTRLAKICLFLANFQIWLVNVGLFFSGLTKICLF